MINFTRRLAEDGRPMYKLNVRGKRVVIPGDIHFPNQHHDSLKAATVTAVDKGDCPILFLQGDTFDMEGFSRFPKDPEKIVKKTSVKKEKEIAKRWLDTWLDIYECIFIMPGNHERRAHNVVYSNAAFTGMGWWWPYGDLFNDPRIIIGDIGYRAELDFGTRPRVFIEHWDEIRGATGKCPAASVAENNPGSHVLIGGHTHRAATVTHSRYFAGKRLNTTAINLGHLSDTRKNGYAASPNWQRGCLYIDEDEQDLRVW